MINRDDILQKSVVHHKNNRLLEAENGYREILEFYPDDPDSNYLLGTIRYSKDEFDTAFTLITKAISLRGDISFYHNNLGLVLHALGKTEEAMQCYLRALELDGNQFLAYYNIGLVYRDNKERIKEIESYKKVLSINPGYTPALHCLGDALRDQGEIKEAITYYERAISNDPSYTEAFTNLINILLCIGDHDSAMARLQAVSFPVAADKFPQLSIISDLMIILWDRNNIVLCRELAAQYKMLLKTFHTKRNKSYLFYFDYLSKLVQHRDNHPEYFANSNSEPLHVIGDSHVLSYANVNLGKFVGRSNLIRGIKMWHLSDSNNHFFRMCLKERLNKIGNNQHLLFAIGEIDCRPDEGIWKSQQEGKGILSNIINDTVQGYLSWLKSNLPPYESITISGIPSPAYKIPDNQFIEMIRQVNSSLKESVIGNGWNFLDVYSLTENGHGVSNNKWHVDDYHLKPQFLSKLYSE